MLNSISQRTAAMQARWDEAALWSKLLHNVRNWFLRLGLNLMNFILQAAFDATLSANTVTGWVRLLEGREVCTTLPTRNTRINNWSLRVKRMPSHKLTKVNENHFNTWVDQNHTGKAGLRTYLTTPDQVKSLISSLRSHKEMNMDTKQHHRNKPPRPSPDHPVCVSRDGQKAQLSWASAQLGPHGWHSLFFHWYIYLAIWMNCNFFINLDLPALCCYILLGPEPCFYSLTQPRGLAQTCDPAA